MSIFGKLFGKKPPAVTAQAAQPDTDPSDPAKDPNMIRVHDAYGREMFITKQAWRDSVLLSHIKKVWNDPDALCSTIIQSLNDGFVADMRKPAEQLAEIDPNHERGAVVLAIVYRDLKNLDLSEKTLRRYIDRYGESGVVLTNLAKVHADRGDHVSLLATLWHGLELDPNQDNGLSWYEALHREKEGPAAGLDALRRIAALPGAWRARLWLARDALTHGQLDEALAFYDEALALAPRPVPADLLMQLSGDLGNNAHLPEILRLVSPHFDLTHHGLQVGNNLIKTHVDLGQLDAAQALLVQLYAQKRPDWQQTLAFWDTEIAKARSEVASVGLTATPKTTTVVIDGPLWLRASSPAVSLITAKTAGAVIVACLGSSFTRADVSSGKIRMQLADVPGRVSRALPLYLAEQLHLRTDAIGRVLQPWVQEAHGGFVLCGAPWSDEQAVVQARGGSEPADYVALVHIDGSSTPWTITLRFLRTIDSTLLGTATTTLTPGNSQPGFDVLAADLLRLVTAHAQVRKFDLPDIYQVPCGNDFAQYQLRLEQALTVFLAATDGVTAGFLNGEREVVNGNLQLCLNHPRNPTPRLLLAQTLTNLKKVRPDIVAEFKDKVALLQKEKPLFEPTQEMTQKILNEVFAA